MGTSTPQTEREVGAWREPQGPRSCSQESTRPGPPSSLPPLPSPGLCTPLETLQLPLISNWLQWPLHWAQAPPGRAFCCRNWVPASGPGKWLCPPPLPARPVGWACTLLGGWVARQEEGQAAPELPPAENSRALHPTPAFSPTPWVLPTAPRAGPAGLVWAPMVTVDLDPSLVSFAAVC